MPDSRTNFVMCINLLVGLLFCAVGGWLIGEAFIWLRNRNAVETHLVFTNDHGEHLVYDPRMMRYSPSNANWVASGSSNRFIPHTNGEPPLLKFPPVRGEPEGTVKQPEGAILEDTETGALYRYQNGRWQKYEKEVGAEKTANPSNVP